MEHINILITIIFIVLHFFLILILKKIEKISYIEKKYDHYTGKGKGELGVAIILILTLIVMYISIGHWFFTEII